MNPENNTALKWLISYLESPDFAEMDSKARVNELDDLMHRLQFERRLAMLSPNQYQAMSDKSLNPYQLAKLKNCKTDAERDFLFTDFARLQYFRDCAWIDYLNGVCDHPPVAAEEPSQV